ncbi:MAG: diguanylate cyclase [Clostridia bacterium]|nr:diguanylate cyclase [Clostridia bacterium]
MKRLLAVTLIILSVVVFCAVGASADEKDLYIDGNAQKIFTSEDGLLSTSTQAVAQTSDGFIWIGGYGGLVRYDGKRFKTFAYKHVTRICDLEAGEDGVLWVATSDKGLFRYADNDFQSIPMENGENADGVNCLAFAPDGRLVLGLDSGLGEVEEDHIHRLDIPELEAEGIDRLLCPDGKRMFCITKSGRLCAWDGQQVRWASADGDYALRSVCFDPANGTYAAGTSGDEVLVFDRELNQVDLLTMEGLSCINDLHCDAGGALWLCADNGIAIYVQGRIRMQNLLMDNSVDQMLVDREGNYWFASSRQGVLEVSRSKFGDVSQSAGLDSMVVNAIQQIGDTLFIGHDAGLVTLNAADFTPIAVEPLAGLAGVRVRALLADDAGSLWIGTMKKGLMRYTPEGVLVSYTSREYPELLSDNIRSITPVEGGVLIGTDKGAYRVTEDGVKNVLDDPGALAFRILCAAQFGDTVYLGSDGNGFYLVQEGKVVRRITTEDGLSSDVIMKEYRSEAYDGLWLVTGNDIDFLHDDGGITAITNFPSTNNLDLLAMANGDAWVFTGTGIYQTTEDSLLHDDAPRYLPYRHVDGLPYEVTPNSYQCLTDDLLYVCGSGGVFSLQTDFSGAEAREYKLVIDSVNADGQALYVRPGDPCTLDSDVRRIDINAYVLTFQTGNPFVFYRLEGFDTEETLDQLSNIGDISYTNLSGGTYTFHFGIRDYKTDAVLQEITFPIVKRFAWYEDPRVRLGAILLGTLLLVLITLLIIRARSRRITRRLQQEYEQKEKTRLQEIAYKDYLTGLYNRNYLEVWNKKAPSEGDWPITFVSIDLNNLKVVNDIHGHADGDRLLRALADLLKKHFGEACYAVVRTGGDEFLVLARGVDGEQVRQKLEQLTLDASAVEVNGIPVTFEYGLCEQQKGHFNFDDGLRFSDLKLLESKNRFHGRTGS